MFKKYSFPVFKTLQIFYPYSIQLYPNEFPGQDPKDCPKTVEKAEWVV